MAFNTNLFTTALLLILANVALANTVEDKCEVGKHKASGKYLACYGKAQRAFTLGGSSDDFNLAASVCEEKLHGKWQKLEVAGAGDCPSSGDVIRAQGLLKGCLVGAASGLSGGALPADPLTCEANLTDCAADLTSCRYTDGGDGTITDNKTGLMWQKLVDDGGISDWDNVGTWSDAFATVATLNANGFAGYTDWRLPNQRELFSLIDLDRAEPSIDPAFSSDCVPGCTSCSCTKVNFYWSSSSDHGDPTRAWLAWFGYGGVQSNHKTEPYNYARAVRGGQ